MDVLWPDSRPREAAHSLHVAISTLRWHLDSRAASYLVCGAGQYAINPDAAVEDDSRTVLAAGEQADRLWDRGDQDRALHAYADVVARYHSDYYVDDHDLIWAVAERERLLARYQVALERLGGIWMLRLDYEAAAECYLRLLDRVQQNS